MLAVCVTFLSVLGQMFRFKDLTCSGCHLLWYFKGFGILGVVRGVVHRVFKVSVSGHVLWHGYLFGMECGGDGDVFCDGRHMS